MQNDAIGKVLHRLDNRIGRHFNSIAESMGLTMVQAAFLLFINDEKEVFQKDLEAEFDIRPSTVTNILRVLERKGFIEKLYVSTDARLKKIVLTKASLPLVQPLYKKVLIHDQDLLKNFSDEEKTALFHLLKKVAQNVSAM